MRTWIGRAFVLVGAFALVAAVVAVFWGRSAAERMPLNVDARTVLEGTASGELAKSETEVPVRYVNTTKADPKASTDAVVALVQTGCIVVQKDDPSDCPGTPEDPDPRTVNMSESAYALDRHSGLAVKDQDKYVGRLAQPGMSGLVSKFPFDTQKTDYQYWDGTLGTTVTAKYAGTRRIDGLETYRFDVDVPATDDVVLAKGKDGAADTRGTYAARQTLWVEPATGAYIDQHVHQTMSLGDTTLLDITLAYSDQTVRHNVTYADSNRAQLSLVRLWLPLAGLLVGLALLGLGLWLVVGHRQRPDGGEEEPAEPRQPAPAGVA